MTGDSLSAQLAQALDLEPPQDAPQAEPVETAEIVPETDEIVEQEAGPVEQTTEESEAPGVEYFADLAQLFDGATEEDLYRSVKFRDGKGNEYTAGELKDRMSDLISVEAQKQAFETQKQVDMQAIEKAKQEIAQANQTLQQAPQELLQAQGEMYAIKSQYERTDWGELAKNDPGEAALLRQNLRESYEAAAGKVQQIQQAVQAQQAQQQSAYYDQAKAKLIAKRPDWSDPKAFMSAIDTMAANLADFEITKEDLMQATDPRIWLAFDELAKLKAEKAGLQHNEKQVKERGLRVLTPKAGKGTKKARLAQLEQRARAPGASEADVKAAQHALLAEAGII